MRRCILLLGVLVSLSCIAAAQGPEGVGAAGIRASVGSEASSSGMPWRFAFGYQFDRIDLNGTPFNTTGANVSVSRLFTGWLGVEGQAGFGFGNSGSSTVPPNLAIKTMSVAAGPRVVHRGPGRHVELWGHALGGMEHFRFSQTAGQLGNNTGLVGLVGGGADFRISRNVTITAEGDEMGTRFFGGFQRHFQAVTSLVFRY